MFRTTFLYLKFAEVLGCNFRICLILSQYKHCNFLYSLIVNAEIYYKYVKSVMSIIW